MIGPNRRSGGFANDLDGGVKALRGGLAARQDKAE